MSLFIYLAALIIVTLVEKYISFMGKVMTFTRVYDCTALFIHAQEEDNGDVVIFETVSVCISALSTYFMATIYIYKGLLIIFGAFLAWQTRKVGLYYPKQYSIWAPVGPNLAQLGPIWECCLGRHHNSLTIP